MHRLYRRRLNRLPDSLSDVKLLARLAALLGLLLSWLGAHAALAQPGSARYEIDPEHVTVAFLVEHVGYAKVLGTFREVEGSFSFDESTRELSDVRVEVKTTSVDTGVERRDQHLRSADFLACERFPTMTFEAEGTRLDASGRASLEGHLTLLGEKRPITLEIVWNKSALSPLAQGSEKPYVLGASARGSFERSAFGMSYGVAEALVGDDVELIIELEAHRRAADP